MKQKNRGNARTKLWRDLSPVVRCTESLPTSRTRRRRCRVTTIFRRNLVSFVGVLAMGRILLGLLGSRSVLLGTKNVINVMRRDISNLSVARMVPS